MRTVYGEDTAARWLRVQFDNLNDYAEQGKGFTDAQLHEMALLILAGYHWVNLAEVCLFIARIKLGHYGQFYGAVGPMKITTAMQDYLRERRESIDMHERRERDRLHIQELETQRMVSASYAAYLELKARAEAGDKDAIAQLTPPHTPKPTG